MTIADTLSKALTEERPVRAEVQLKAGGHRVRIGLVANLTPTHVTIWDAAKGFRTAPLELVLSVEVDESTPRSVYQAAFELMTSSLAPRA